MGFEIFPAIDVRGGLLAAMRGGDPATLITRDGDPLEVARAFVAAGARWLHVVDLDAALAGAPANTGLLARMAGLGVPVQAGGGLDAEAAVQALGRGAARAVLGAGALADREHAERLFAAHPGRIAVGLDVRGDRIAPRGGAYPSEPLEPVLRWLEALTVRPRLVVVTDVESDGSLAGTDGNRLLEIADRTGLPVVASGGIRSVDDLRALAAMQPRVAGAIVGRALTEGAFTLEGALEAVG